MNAKITNFINTSKGYLKKHSPEILTGIGVAGMITSTILAVKATPKALELIEKEVSKRNKEAEREAIANGHDICNQIDKLKPLEVIKVAWKPYIPAVLTGVASISCIIGASTINSKRNAALATAYSISEKALIRYRDKVIETIGEKKEKEIKEQIAQDEVDKKPVSSSSIIMTSKGNTLCMDYMSGRYFKSDLDTIRKAINELNREMTYQNYVSLDEFYNKIGLEPIKNSDRLGWNLDNGLIELELSTCLTDEDEPCIVIDYSIAPKYDFDKLS